MRAQHIEPLPPQERFIFFFLVSENNEFIFIFPPVVFATDLCNIPLQSAGIWYLGEICSCIFHTFCSSSCHRSVLFIWCWKRASGDRGEVAFPSQWWPVASGHRREECQTGQSPGGSPAPADPKGPDGRSHPPGTLQPAVCWWVDWKIITIYPSVGFRNLHKEKANTYGGIEVLLPFLL